MEHALVLRSLQNRYTRYVALERDQEPCPARWFCALAKVCLSQSPESSGVNHHYSDPPTRWRGSRIGGGWEMRRRRCATVDKDQGNFIVSLLVNRCSTFTHQLYIHQRPFLRQLLPTPRSLLHNCKYVLKFGNKGVRPHI